MILVTFCRRVPIKSHSPLAPKLFLLRRLQHLRRIAAEQQQLFSVGQKCLGLGRKGLAPLPLAGDIAALHPAVGQQIEQAARPDDGVGRCH